MDLANSLNWNLIKRESYTAQIISQDSEGYKFLALRDIQIPVRSPILMVGIKSSKAKPYWVTGGWASQLLFILPSSTTQFTAAIRVGYAQRCQLGILNLIQFPYTGVSPFILNISFPYWLEQIDLEVWQYGEAMDGTYEPPNTELYKVADGVARIEERLGQGQGGDRTLNIEIIEEP